MSADDIQAKLRSLNIKIRRIIDLMKILDVSPELEEDHRNAQRERAELLRLQQAANAPVPIRRYTSEEVADFLDRKCAEVATVLAGDPELAKAEVAKRVEQLVMTPVETPDGPAYEVSGDLRLLGADEIMESACFHKSGDHYDPCVLPIRTQLICTKRKRRQAA